VHLFRWASRERMFVTAGPREQLDRVGPYVGNRSMAEESAREAKS